jgi:2-oxoglutarate ferredoxin oxidoreductase subunit alpha
MASAAEIITPKEAEGALAPESVVVRFAGDSGDGMQLDRRAVHAVHRAGGQRPCDVPGLPGGNPRAAGHAVRRLGVPDQLRLVRHHTAGDAPDVLVAMNPAALKTNVKALKPGGLIIADTGEFTKRNLEKAKYEVSPLEDGSLAKVARAGIRHQPS